VHHRPLAPVAASARRRTRGIVAVLALALAACERSTALPPCPGVVQGRVFLTTTLRKETGGQVPACAAAALPEDAVDASQTVAAALSFIGEGGAAVCLERTLADPLLGTRTADRIDVAAQPEPVAVDACGCAVTVVERLSGTIVRDASGAAVGLADVSLVNALAAADGATACPPAGTAACPVPCDIHFTVQGAP
jgi:hypothetical protein